MNSLPNEMLYKVLYQLKFTQPVKSLSASTGFNALFDVCKDMRSISHAHHTFVAFQQLKSGMAQASQMIRFAQSSHAPLRALAIQQLVDLAQSNKLSFDELLSLSVDDSEVLKLHGLAGLDACLNQNNMPVLCCIRLADHPNQQLQRKATALCFEALRSPQLEVDRFLIKALLQCRNPIIREGSANLIQRAQQYSIIGHDELPLLLQFAQGEELKTAQEQASHHVKTLMVPGQRLRQYAALSQRELGHIDLNQWRKLMQAWPYEVEELLVAAQSSILHLKAAALEKLTTQVQTASPLQLHQMAVHQMSGPSQLQDLAVTRVKSLLQLYISVSDTQVLSSIARLALSPMAEIQSLAQDAIQKHADALIARMPSLPIELQCLFVGCCVAKVHDKALEELQQYLSRPHGALAHPEPGVPAVLKAFAESGVGQLQGKALVDVEHALEHHEFDMTHLCQWLAFDNTELQQGVYDHIQTQMSQQKYTAQDFLHALRQKSLVAQLVGSQGLSYLIEHGFNDWDAIKHDTAAFSGELVQAIEQKMPQLIDFTHAL